VVDECAESLHTDANGDANKETVVDECAESLHTDANGDANKETVVDECAESLHTDANGDANGLACMAYKVDEVPNMVSISQIGFLI
jgi:hypothetical protein